MFRMTTNSKTYFSLTLRESVPLGSCLERRSKYPADFVVLKKS